MLKLFRTVIVIIFTKTTLLSQAPQSICYQAVATDQADTEYFGDSKPATKEKDKDKSALQMNRRVEIEFIFD